MEHLSNDHKTITISTRIVISHTMKQGILFWVYWKVTSGLVPLVDTWNCYTSYKNEYAGLLVLYLLLFLNHGPIVKICSSENWLNWFHFLSLEGSPLVILIDCMIFLSPFLDVTRMFIATVSFLAQLGSGILCL